MTMPLYMLTSWLDHNKLGWMLTEENSTVNASYAAAGCPTADGPALRSPFPHLEGKLRRVVRPRFLTAAWYARAASPLCRTSQYAFAHFAHVCGPVSY
jgi:hypothetical protein